MNKAATILIFVLSWLNIPCIHAEGVLDQIDSIQYKEPQKALSLLRLFESDHLTTVDEQIEINQFYGNIKWHIGEMDSSIYYYNKAASLSKRHDNILMYASVLSDIGYVYSDISKFDSAIMYLQKSITLAEELDNETMIFRNKTFLAHCYDRMKERQKAIQINQEVLAYYQKIKSEAGVAKVSNNLGSLYWAEEMYDSALVYFRSSVTVFIKNGDENLYSVSYYNLGNCHSDIGNYDSAMYYMQKAIALFEKNQNGFYTPGSYSAYGNILIKSGKWEEAIPWLQKALMYMNDNQKENNMLKMILLKNLSQAYYNSNQFKESYEYLNEFLKLEDSLSMNERNKLVKELEAKYESEKKGKEIELLNKDKEKQRIVIVAIVFGLFLLLIFLWFVYNRLKIIRQQKYIIEETNEELNQTNEELAAQRDEIENQKNKVEEAHNEIKDSIIYAKRIQNAILPSHTFMKEVFPESFVFYQPKDVVAGDFYWLETISAPVAKAVNADQSPDLILFAVADCTGHGVPGAMVSVVCHNAMNRAVREFGLTDPGKILDKTREIVLEELSKSEEDVKDGMDIALCSLKREAGSWQLQYAGAHNPLWIVKANSELVERKADKQPIGKFENPTPFTTHTIDFHQGDTIYIFSDGYIDQFGGERDKKFGSKQFKELLISIQDKTIAQQKEILQTSINHWMIKGNTSQIDDICILAVKHSR